MSTLHELKYFAWAPSPSVFFFGMAAPFKPFFWRETTPPPPTPNPTSPASSLERSLKGLNYLKEAQLLDAYSSYNADSINVRFKNKFDVKHKRTILRRVPSSAAVVDVVVHIEN